MSLYNEAGQLKDFRPEHYHGDIVRKLFLVSGVLMLVSYAFFWDLILVPISFSVLAVVLLVVLAGMENPRYVWLTLLNTVVSGFGCFAFAYTGIIHYQQAIPFNPWFFWSNQLLALLFLVATYYSSKTMRAKLMGKI